MDKNFENIDNLFKQRMGGGETPERNGAWQNMRELLDKEMPQAQPVGFFQWGKLLSVAAAVVITGTLAVGGYKAATYLKSSNAENTTADVAAIPANTTPVATGTAGNSNEPARQIPAAGSQGAQQNTAGATNGTQTSQANDSRVANTNKEVAGKNSNTYNSIAVVNTKNIDNKATQINTQSPTGNTANKNNHAGDPAVTPAKNAPARTGNKANTVAENKTADCGNTTAANIPAQHNTAGVNTNNVAVNNTNNNVAASNTPADRSPVANNATGVKVGNTNNVTEPANNVNRSRAENNTVSAGVPVFVTKTGKRIPGDRLQKINIDRAQQNQTDKATADANTIKGKRVIQRMALVEHFIKTTGSEGFYKLDTISVVTFTEELGISDNKPAVPSHTPVKKTTDSKVENKAKK